MNDHTLYEHILSNDLFFGVVGMLEYDPEFPTHKANYRSFLTQTSQFHAPIPISDPAILRKIHATYRLQFLKDVVLARALDDSTFNVLNSCIIFNQIDIITHVQQNVQFLREVVSLFVDEEMLSGGNNNNNPLVGRIALPQQVVLQPQVQEGDKMDVDSISNGDVEPPKNDTDTPTQEPSSSDTVPATSSQPQPSATQPPAPATDSATHPPDHDPKSSHRRLVVLLIHSLCQMGKSVQLPARLALFRALVDRGILFSVQWALSQPESTPEGISMIGTGGEILSALLDHDLNGVRGHVLKQVTAIGRIKERNLSGKAPGVGLGMAEETVLQLICRMLAASRDLGVQSQIGDALKVLMDIPEEPQPGATGGVNTPAKIVAAKAKDDPNVEKFLEYFYDNCFTVLFKPLIDDVPTWKDAQALPGGARAWAARLSRERINLFVYQCDLLCQFYKQYSFRAHFAVLGNGLMQRVATLLESKDKHLKVAAFRFFRALVDKEKSNVQIVMYMGREGLMGPILDLTVKETKRDSLLSCAIIEYFQWIRAVSAFQSLSISGSTDLHVRRRKTTKNSSTSS